MEEEVEEGAEVTEGGMMEKKRGAVEGEEEWRAEARVEAWVVEAMEEFPELQKERKADRVVVEWGWGEDTKAVDDLDVWKEEGMGEENLAKEGNKEEDALGEERRVADWEE